SAKNFNCKTTSNTKNNNSTPVTSKYDKYIKTSSFKISNNLNNYSPTIAKHQEEELVFNISKNQITDFFCCTISGSSASTVNSKLKEYCEANSIDIKEVIINNMTLYISN